VKKIQVYRKTLYICLFVYLSLSSLAQDIHFSQFFNSPLSLNPAYTGDIDAIWRANANFRSQWSAFPEPFNTTAATFDIPKYFDSKTIGLGVGFIHDESGSLLLTADKVFISGAYEHTLVSMHKIRAGIQIGFTHKSIDTRRITLPNQFDNTIGDFNQAIWSGEDQLNDKSSYMDVNIGATWSKSYAWGTPETGIAFYHVNYPKENFYKDSERLAARLLLHGNLKYKIDDRYMLLPRFVSMIHKRATYFNIGSEVYYNLSIKSNIKKQLFLGLFVRNNFSKQPDALIFDAGLVFDNVKFGVSYDINISSLNTVTKYNGALEFALLYTFSYDKYKNYTVPCKRL
jgi:type IX secretion system PorP/SprF family membrane protein